MQQTSEHLIAYQTVSLTAYQRLRETLMQQRHVFESVITESQMSHSQASAQGSSQASVKRGESIESFVLMCSSKLNVLLTVMPLGGSDLASSGPSPAGHHPIADKHARFQGKDRDLATDRVAASSGEYRVGLTFDDRAIAVFIDKLNIFENVGLSPEEISQKEKNKPHHPFPPSIAHPELHSETAISADERLVAQKAFVLSWAKNLATSPEGDPQPIQTVLDNQLQQSLLLDQVITRIRHSLDLPAILRATVAQVREFLSADRLVLYQFDQFDMDENVSVAEVIEREKRSQQQAADSAQPNRQSPEPIVGQSTHSGHVTYESRASKDIGSVLHLSEEECFSPSLAVRDRYLAGQPIAIDDVEARYANVGCLLAFLQQAEVKSKIIAPIIVKNRLWGLLIVHQCRWSRHWEKTETVFLQHIAEHLAVAISQASLYQQLRQQTVSLESCVIERTRSLHDALVAAESANVTKGEFLSTMSHELRTPLTYIIGMSATLLRWSLGDLNDQQRSYLATINQSGEQLLDVINSILEFASVESGRSLLEFTQFSLAELMASTISPLQAMADKQDVSLSLEVKSNNDQDAFRADAKRLQLIINNLVHNAIKFTGAGGRVDVRVWRDSKTAIFQVTDTGIGIPESQKSSLFEKFKQLESPFQRQYSGTGLGLAMTKRLVELHGGSIQVDSQVGKGSTFTVQLPVLCEPVIPKHYQLPTALQGGAERIVLLETDEDDAAIACEMLTAAGYEVIWLVEAEELATKLDLLQPVMLVANLSLLNHKHHDIKAIQRSITALDTRVLALSTSEGSVASSVAHHDSLHKPIDPKLLLEKSRQLMMLSA